MNNKPFAEIIESSLDSFLAQCWQWDDFPTFGSLVQVENDGLTIFGCVASIQTGSSDPMRYPFPYQKTLDELKKEQPQIFAFLKTTFRVHVLGHQKAGGPIYTLPPQPGKIHSFVTNCPQSSAQNFFAKPDFLYLLFSSASTITHFDDLLLAILQQLTAGKKLSAVTLDAFFKTLSLLTGNDYRKLKLLFKRVESTNSHQKTTVSKHFH